MAISVGGNCWLCFASELFCSILIERRSQSFSVLSTTLSEQRISFFAMDVFVSAAAVWLFVFIEGRRLKMPRLWLYVLCTMVVGVSFALPLFLFFRDRQLEGQTLHFGTRLP